MSNPAQSTALTPPAQSDEEGVIRRAVKQLDVTLNAPMAMLAEGIVQAGGQAQSDQEHQQLISSAQEQVKMLAGVGEMNQITVTKDDAITSSLHYADNQVEFNGRKISLAEFIAPLSISLLMKVTKAMMPSQKLKTHRQRSPASEVMSVPPVRYGRR